MSVEKQMGNERQMHVLGFRTHYIYIHTIFCLLNCSFVTIGINFFSVILGTCLMLSLLIRLFKALLLPPPLLLKGSLSSYINRRGGGREAFFFFVSVISRYFQKHADISSSSGLLYPGRRAVFCRWLLPIHRVRVSLLSCISLTFLFQTKLLWAVSNARK